MNILSVYFLRRRDLILKSERNEKKLKKKMLVDKCQSAIKKKKNGAEHTICRQ